MKLPDVTVEYERIDIAFDGSFAEVKVRYDLLNSGSEKRFDFAFALDALEGEFFRAEAWTGKAVDVDASWKALAPSFSIRVGGSAAKVGYKDERTRLRLDGRDTGVFRRWAIAPVVLSAGKATLEIEYRIMLAWYSWGIDVKGSRPHGFYFDESDHAFLYDLSPSGSFGNGRAKTLEIGFDFKRALDAGFAVSRADPFGVPTSGMERLSGTWSDFDYSGAPPLRVEFDALGSVVAKEAVIPRDAIRKVSASSSLGSAYAADMAFDGSLATAWAEGAAGSGIGEWIEVEFGDAASGRGRDVYAIELCGGYAATGKLYRDNNRITEIMVEWTAVDGTVGSKRVSVLPPEYPHANPFSRFAAYAERAYLGLRAVRRIRIAVLGVQKGDLYDDTCIAEIRFRE